MNKNFVNGQDLNDKGMDQIFLINIVSNIFTLIFENPKGALLIAIAIFFTTGVMFNVMVPLTIGMIFVNLGYFNMVAMGRLERQWKFDQWYVTLCSHNWRWFWKTQKHRVNFDKSMSGAEEQEMMKYLGQYKPSDWVAFDTSFINVCERAEGPTYLSFRTREMAIEYKMRYG